MHSNRPNNSDIKLPESRSSTTKTDFECRCNKQCFLSICMCSIVLYWIPLFQPTKIIVHCMNNKLIEEENLRVIRSFWPDSGVKLYAVVESGKCRLLHYILHFRPIYASIITLDILLYLRMIQSIQCRRVRYSRHMQAGWNWPLRGHEVPQDKM